MDAGKVEAVEVDSSLFGDVDRDWDSRTQKETRWDSELSGSGLF